MSSITQLPSNVWSQIFSYTTLESFRDVSLTCKCLHKDSREVQKLSGLFLATELLNTKWAPATLQRIQLTTGLFTDTDAIDILKETVEKARKLWHSLSHWEDDLQDCSPQRIYLYQSRPSFNKLLILEDEQHLLLLMRKAKGSDNGSRAALRRASLGDVPHSAKTDILSDVTGLTISDLPATETSLPTSIGNLKSLVSLSVAENGLVSVPESIGNLTCLAALDLGANRIQGIPNTLGNLARLQILYLHRNELEAVPDSLGNLTSLFVLYLNKNKLKTLPSLEHLTALQSLYLQENELSSLTRSIGNLFSLTVLDLSQNKLKLLPDTITHCRHLKKLNLQMNQLQKLPPGFDSLCLEQLNVENNPDLEKDEESVRMLKALYKEGCRIQCDPAMKKFTGIA